MKNTNPWKLSPDNRVDGARVLREYVEDSFASGHDDDHPVTVAADWLMRACHETGEVEIGLAIHAAFLAMKYGHEEARDRLLSYAAMLVLEYEPLNPERN